MTSLVQILQAFSGLLWIVTAVLLTPRIAASWRPTATRIDAMSAPLGILAWLMAGFAIRWLVWSHALDRMQTSELLTWAALYMMSALCAVWVCLNALEMRGR